MSLPWEKNFVSPGVDPDLVKQAEDLLNQATETATEVVGGVAGAVGGPGAGQVVHDVGAAVGAAEQAAGQLVPPAISGSSNAPLGGALTDISSAIQAVAAQTAAAAAASALPILENRLAGAAADALKRELDTLGQPPVASIPKGDLKKVDAWERAARTFGIGLFLTVLGAIVQVLGQVATDGTTIDWFHKDGWTAVATLAVGAVVSSVSSYVLRYIKEPAGAGIDSSTDKTT